MKKLWLGMSLREYLSKRFEYYEETGLKIDPYYRNKLIEEIARMIEDVQNKPL